MCCLQPACPLHWPEVIMLTRSFLQSTSSEERGAPSATVGLQLNVID